MFEFEKIYFEYSEPVFRFIFKMCGESALSEELTARTFARAYSSIGRYKGAFSVRAWLSSIALSEYVRYLRKVPLGTTPLKPGEAIRREIFDLPDLYRGAVILRLYAGIPFSEIAAIYGISQNSVKVVYCRAKKMLSEVM